MKHGVAKPTGNDRRNRQLSQRVSGAIADVRDFVCFGSCHVIVSVD